MIVETIIGLAVLAGVAYLIYNMLNQKEPSTKVAVQSAPATGVVVKAKTTATKAKAPAKPKAAAPKAKAAAKPASKEKKPTKTAAKS